MRRLSLLVPLFTLAIAVPGCLVSDQFSESTGAGGAGLGGLGGAAGSSVGGSSEGPGGVSGTNGTNGSSGTDGTSGANGASGTSGSNGASGTGGTDGTSGASGTDGTGGAAASNGTGGTGGTGAQGGTSGSAGIAGSSATGGTAGVSGSTGSSGSAGMSGVAGSAGVGGSSGMAGVSGATSIGGAAGTGMAGSAALGGSAGMAGAGAVMGAAGSSGVSGTGGFAGSAGSPGIGGSAGSAGSMAGAGIGGGVGVGGAGSAGMAGSAGVAGSAGMAGSAGTAGTGGIVTFGPPSCGSGLLCSDPNNVDDPTLIDCCDSIEVPSATFTMGRGVAQSSSDLCPTNMSCNGDEIPEHPATVSGFRLDRFEVTVGRFRAFVNAFTGPPNDGDGANPFLPGSGWKSAWNTHAPVDKNGLRDAVESCGALSTFTTGMGSHEQQPLNCVSWYIAFEFCTWDGGFLPTEVEWESVAADAEQNRLYPWGSSAQASTRASFNCLGDGLAGCLVDDLRTVNSYALGKGGLGHRNLAGNVAEWTFDGYDNHFYDMYAGSSPQVCTDCGNVTDNGQRTIRGGSFKDEQTDLRAAAREGIAAGYSGGNSIERVGIRCARPSQLIVVGPGGNP